MHLIEDKALLNAVNGGYLQFVSQWEFDLECNLVKVAWLGIGACMGFAVSESVLVAIVSAGLAHQFVGKHYDACYLEEGFYHISYY